ncbi:MAG: alpha/beta hydrolase [Planctomycetota bacterium]
MRKPARRRPRGMASCRCPWPRQKEAPRTPTSRKPGEYYHTPRASCPTAPGWGTARSLTQLATFDAFHFAENFLTQPLLVIAGSQAESKWMSDDLMHRAASKDKRLHIIDGANHMMLYDIPQYVDQATEQLGPFFRAKL